MIEKKQLTVRLPLRVFDYLTQRAESEQKTLNDIMVDITEQHMMWHEGEKLIKEIGMIRERTQRMSGVQPDSTDDIRSLRDGER
ncbi:hypothetical protein [Paenibacillus alkalitolerans]|uniref:hypothetical protein n=1 Tax=Paenibacillus alkalitolerans TaxID=2799335 RepID=UPI0018F5186D|nr:hypothetical protein [Paenibacillus alkalitolerans]